LGLMRRAFRAAGLTDPFTGAPAIAPAIAAFGTWVDSNLVQPVAGPPDPDTFFTPRDLGVLEGALAAQGLLMFTGAEEVQLALRVVAAAGSVKGITDVMAKDDLAGKPWTSDPIFYAQLANAVVYFLGLGSSATNKKLAAAVADWASQAIGTSPSLLKLEADWRTATGPDREKIIHDDVMAVITAIALAVMQLLGMASSQKPGPKTGSGTGEQTQKLLPQGDLTAAPQGEGSPTTESPQVIDPAQEVTQPLVKVTDPAQEVTHPLVKVTDPEQEVTQPLVKVTDPEEVTRPADDELGEVDDVTESSGSIVARVATRTPGEVEAATHQVLDDLKAVALSRGGVGTPDTRAMQQALAQLRAKGVDITLVEKLTKTVMDAFADPSALAKATGDLQRDVLGLSDAEIVTEARALNELGIKTGLDERAAAYVAAVKKRAAVTGIVEIRRVGADKVELRLTKNGKLESADTFDAPDGVMPHDVFMEEVVRGGYAILDYALLGDEHGSMTHALHDRVADAALKEAGYSEGSAGYRALLGELNDQARQNNLNRLTMRTIPGDFLAGTALWLATYDATGGIASPEVLWGPAIRDGVLKLPPDVL
jgi:hypothetical protein